MPVPWVSDGYFRTLGIPVLRGRVFDSRDQRGSPDVMVISETLARRYFPGEDPVGQRIKHGGPSLNNPYLEIIGVVGDVKFVSTPSDLARFGMGVEKLLKRDTVRLLQTSQRLASGEETDYGLGWDLETVTLAGEPTRVAGHDGEVLGGMVASLATFPERGMVVAVTSNISYADTFSVAVKVAEGFARK